MRRGGNELDVASLLDLSARKTCEGHIARIVDIPLLCGVARYIINKDDKGRAPSLDTFSRDTL